MKIKNLFKIVGTSSLFLLLATISLAAGAITVCDSGCTYTTIDDALLTAIDGDTINIGPGTYTTSITLTTRSIDLVGNSEDPPIIHANGEDHALKLDGVGNMSISDIIFKGAALNNLDLSNSDGNIFDNITATETLDGTELSGIGMIFEEGSDGNTITDSTFSSNDYGVVFSGASEDNTINDSTFTTNNIVDIGGNATGNNSLKNSDFETISNLGTGYIEIFYKVRAYVHEQSTPIPSATVTLYDTATNEVFTDFTDIEGYTDYSEYLSAYKVTSEGNVDTGNLHSYSVESGELSQSFVNFVLGSVSQLLDIDLYEEDEEEVTTGGGGGGGFILLQKKKKAKAELALELEGGLGQLEEEQEIESVSIPSNLAKHWARKYVEKIYQNLQIAEDWPVEEIEPDKPFTREKALKLIMQYMEVPVESVVSEDPYADVSKDSDYAPYIAKAKEMGIIGGSKDDYLIPEKAISRSAVLKIAFESAGFEGNSNPKLTVPFSDVKDGDWDKSYIITAYHWGVVVGYRDGTFRPDGVSSQAEILKIMKLIKDKKDIVDGQ